MKSELLLLDKINYFNGPKRTLDCLTLSIYQGEIVFLIGDSESGKNELISVIHGEEYPDGGKMQFGGKVYKPESTRDAEHSGVYIVNKEAPNFTNMPAWEVIGLTRPLYTIHTNYRKNMRSYVYSICDDFHININFDRNMDKLASHEKILAQLLISILTKAKVVILRDVLPTINEKNAETIFSVILQMKNAGVSFLVSEASSKYAREYADRVVFIREGLIVADMTNSQFTPDKEALLKERPTGRVIETDKEDESVKIQSNKTFLFHKDNEICSIPIAPGRCIGLTYRDPNSYSEALSRDFSEVAVREANGRHISIINVNDISKGSFLFMTMKDNISLPILKSISHYGVIRQSDIRQFIENEFRNRVSKDDLKQKMTHLSFGKRCEAALYRTLLEKSDVFLIKGYLDQVSDEILEKVFFSVKTAMKINKTVIMYVNNSTVLHEWCSNTLYIDDIGTN